MIFKKIHVIFKFRNEKNKKKKLGAFCRIELNGNFMHMISRKLWALMEKGKEEKKFKNREIPKFTENSLHRILDVAKEMKISWPFLINTTFHIKNISFKKYKTHIRFASGGSKNLLLVVHTDHGDIDLELEKKKFDAWTPSEDLKDIKNVVENYRDTYRTYSRF